MFSLFVSRSGTLGTQTATVTSYMQQDHLGSVAVITNETGAVAERLAYDPWGKRRYVNGVADAAGSIVGVNTDRGYTMQEHIDEMGVINMNARVYDPLIGRFMSPDDIIPNPFDMKAFNRYSYVSNNPLRGVDPTGHLVTLFGGDEGGGGPRFDESLFERFANTSDSWDRSEGATDNFRLDTSAIETPSREVSDASPQGLSATQDGAGFQVANAGVAAVGLIREVDNFITGGLGRASAEALGNGETAKGVGLMVLGAVVGIGNVAVAEGKIVIGATRVVGETALKALGGSQTSSSARNWELGM